MSPVVSHKSANQPDARTRRILLVDDDDEILRLLTLRLKNHGYSTIEAASGEQALALLGNLTPDLIITDMRMGGISGLGLFDEVHARFPGLPVIMLTSHGSVADAVEAMRRGLVGYLTKPVESHDLAREVGRALALGGKPAAGADADWRAGIVTRSALMEQVLADAWQVAQGDASVLVTGPSGSGKELLARAIHAAGRRAKQPFVAVNCAAIPEQLLESELFGHVKGAFTGAIRDHTGLLQAAHGGTLFLDEIGDMPAPLQAKLLRALQERVVRPVGAVANVAIDVRIVCATHHDLALAIAAGRFREDLFYRLNVVGLLLPSLAERREDIPLLASHFLSQLAARYDKTIKGFAPEALQMLLGQTWRGNVRQLANAVEKCVAMCVGEIVPASLVQRAVGEAVAEVAGFDQARARFERDYLTQILKIAEGNVTKAARLAKRNRSDFYTLLARHALEPAAFKGLAPR